MNTNLLLTQFLIFAMALVMFGLGLSLSPADFRRLLKYPRAVAVALALQVLVLPVLCFGLATWLALPPVFAIGLMLLAASPGGVSANLFSHLFGGNVAMNISLTAINTVLSIVTLPLISNWAIAHFASGGQVVPVQTGKVFEVILVVALPVIAGMSVRVLAPRLSLVAATPMKIVSAVALALFSFSAIAKEWAALTASFAEIGGAVVAFNVVSLVAGYAVARATGLDKPLSTAISFEIGVHNSALALFVALSVLKNFQLGLPAAVYSVSMYLTATLFGLALAGVRPAAVARTARA